MSYLLLFILSYFLKSLEIGSIALFLGANKYVFKETHGTESDAIQLVAHEIGVTTYAIQYSNLIIKNSSMQSKLLINSLFFRFYQKTFADESFGPREFQSYGISL